MSNILNKIFNQMLMEPSIQPSMQPSLYLLTQLLLILLTKLYSLYLFQLLLHLEPFLTKKIQKQGDCDNKHRQTIASESLVLLTSLKY